MKTALIVAAGGLGKRFGQNKQFFLYKNKPVLVYTLASIERSRNAGLQIDQLIISTGDVEKTRIILSEYNIKYDNTVLPRR